MLNSQYRYVPVRNFIEGYQSFGAGKLLAKELSVPFDRRYNHPAALSRNTYGVKRTDLLKISFFWQMLLLKRNSFVFVFKFMQVMFPCNSIAGLSIKNGCYIYTYIYIKPHIHSNWTVFCFAAVFDCCYHDKCVLSNYNAS